MLVKPNFSKINITETVLPILVFFVCSVIYLANGVPISAPDTIPNTLLAFNLLENNTFNLDAFRASYFCTNSYANCYFFAEANHGHLSSIYPIGTAIVTFPLYLIFYAYLKLISFYASVSLDLTSASFEIYRVFFEKLAATITTAITVIIFYLSVRLKFSLSISLISTFIFAFATNIWMTSSQGLWQHTASNLALISIIFCLLKANRASEKSQKIWLLIAGVACGLLPGIRPTSTLYTIAAIIYSIFTYRFKSVYLFFGLVSALPSIAWNLYYFGNLTGGYSKMFPAPPYKFTFNNFIRATLGTLVSPSRGLLVFSPIVLYSLPGAYQVFKLRAGKDEKLIGCMTIASIVLLSSYCFYIIWWAGNSYGPRFMTDMMPVVGYLISYFLVHHLQKLIHFPKILYKKSLVVFIVLVTFSTFTQSVGALGANPGCMWSGLPMNVDVNQNQYRLWSFKDSQIERNAKAVFHKILKPFIDNPAYVKGLGGIIKQVADENNQPLGSLISVKPSSEKVLKAKLENTGTSRWFGYESALEKGEVRVKGRFYDERNKEISEARLYVSGTPKQHELTYAIGSITFPKEPGIYKLVFDLVSEGVGIFPNSNGKPFSEIDINVVNQKPKDSQLLLKQVFSQEIKILNHIGTVKVSSTLRIPILLKNKSNFIWSNAGRNPTNFSYRWLDASGKQAVFQGDGDRTVLPFDLSPGESAALNAIIKNTY
ncbi:glycosyltransferase family 39 protein [Nostoc sp. 'Peltigera malacea cyanobiont' DB3992]|uniref:glycosyltransferase family 39 protein n=1 Tax=Nostoc sp. 'Peltigera malacea cyanobiont' DB3992 TaxID=1206980 RepID=UPI00211DA57C|nr:glycosyltransferase family 39 protein [Nostoc sp. 'Peltigera malacea cyanobiont' DB3992]